MSAVQASTRAAGAAARVIESFITMRQACPSFAGIGSEWDHTQCLRAGNNQIGSICSMGYCPQVREAADARKVGW